MLAWRQVPAEVAMLLPGLASSPLLLVKSMAASENISQISTSSVSTLKVKVHLKVTQAVAGAFLFQPG